MKFVVDEHIPFIRGVLEQRAEVVYRPGSKISPGDVRDADGLIVRTRTRCDKDLLEGSRVRFVATATIGFDHIDTAYCEEHGIFWTNAEGCNSSSVRQYVASILAQWQADAKVTWNGTTIGIVGVGNVGKKVAQVSAVLGMTVLKNDLPRERQEGPGEFVSLDEIIQRSDIITLHVPLNMDGPDRTFHLFDRELLERLRPHQRLINSSRGEVVDTHALKTALERKQIAGCVLDVWENEPHIDSKLVELVEIATPHIAGYSADGKANGTSMCVQAASRFFGFGLDSWTPVDIPVPSRANLRLDCASKSAAAVLSALILQTYDVREDDRRLRASLTTFEAQRAGYPLRREFPTYSVVLENASPSLLKQAEEIGFKINT